MSHKCTGLLVTQPSVSLSLCWSLSLHLVAQSSRSFLLLIHSHQESQSNSANVEEARRWGWCMGSMPFTRGQNLMYTWRLTATDCIYFLQPVPGTSIAPLALPVGKWEPHVPIALPRHFHRTDTVVGLPQDPLTSAGGQCSWILSSQVPMVKTTGSHRAISLVACPLSVAGVLHSGGLCAEHDCTAETS